MKASKYYTIISICVVSALVACRQEGSRKERSTQSTVVSVISVGGTQAVFICHYDLDQLKLRGVSVSELEKSLQYYIETVTPIMGAVLADFLEDFPFFGEARTNIVMAPRTGTPKKYTEVLEYSVGVREIFREGVEIEIQEWWQGNKISSERTTFKLSEL